MAHPAAILGAALFVAIWLVGAVFGAEGWPELLAAGGTVVTVLLVFLLQHAQLHDTRALHAKLDELILSLKEPRDEVAGIEERAEQELEAMRSRREP
jgi:low affinity Fe/Cu permease